MKLLALFALLLLASPGFAETPAELIEKLKNSDSDEQRRQAIEKLGEMKAVEAVPTLTALLRDKNSIELRDAARSALKRMGPAVSPSLLEKLKTADEKLKLNLLSSLREMQPDTKQALPVMKELLKDKSIDVRIHAAAVLGNLSGDSKLAHPILFEAAKDTSNLGSGLRPGLPMNVSTQAIQSAKKIDPKCLEALAKEILPGLIKAIKSKDKNEHIAACFAISELDEFAAPAKAELIEARKRDVGFTRYTLDPVLKKLGVVIKDND